MARLWGVESVPATPGKTAVEMFQAAADGEIKALWIACTNPAQSLPDQATVRRALQRAEFVVVQEAFATTATCTYADLLLPATTWGEKDGTVTNSERRISRVRPAVGAAARRAHDWAIATAFAQRLEARLRPGRPSLFAYASAESVWNEHRESTRGRDLDITGLSYARSKRRPQQWPFPPRRRHEGRARLYEDGVFPTPTAAPGFADTRHLPLAEPREARWSFALTTGRLRDQWHGMSRTGTVAGVRPRRRAGHRDARAGHGAPVAAEGDLVHVTRGAAPSCCRRASTQIALAQAFIAMHWGDEFLTGRSANGTAAAGVNALTSPAFCPSSRQPELKHAAVKILKGRAALAAARHGLAAGWRGAARTQQLPS